MATPEEVERNLDAVLEPYVQYRKKAGIEVDHRNNDEDNDNDEDNPDDDDPDYDDDNQDNDDSFDPDDNHGRDNGNGRNDGDDIIEHLRDEL